MAALSPTLAFRGQRAIARGLPSRLMALAADAERDESMSERDVIRVGIAGVRGYKGFETARLVGRHPRFRVVMISSDAMAGHRLKDFDRDLVRDGMAQAVGYNDTLSASKDYGVDLMFLATEPEVCAALGKELLAAGIAVMDLSGAHAVKSAEVHTNTYGFPYPEVAKDALLDRKSVV